MNRFALTVLLALLLSALPGLAAPIFGLFNPTFSGAQVIPMSAFTQPAPAEAMLNGPTASINYGLSRFPLYGVLTFTPDTLASYIFDVDSTFVFPSASLALYYRSGNSITLTAYSVVSTPLDVGSNFPDAFLGRVVLNPGVQYYLAVFNGLAIPVLTGTTGALVRPDGGEGGFGVNNNLPEASDIPAFTPSSIGIPPTVHITIETAGTPEPGTFLLAGGALSALVLLRKRMGG